MKTIAVLFASIAFASALFAQSGDPAADMRFRMKFGRSIARQDVTKTAKSKQSKDCESGCCRHRHEAGAAGRPA
jgi:hypothetical protein